MQKLSNEQAAGLPKKYRGNLSPVYRHIIDLKPGENLHVTKGDWSRKYPISKVIRRIQQKHNRAFTLSHLANDLGWLVTRER